MESTAARAIFARALSEEVGSGRKTLLLAPLGTGKTHALAAVRETLQERDVPFVFVDLFTAASTPERLLALLAKATSPFMEPDAAAIGALVAEGARDRQASPEALLKLFELLASRPAARPFVWLIDEVTEIRSLAYFPGLGRIEAPLAKAIAASRGAVLTSSYLGLAVDLFPNFEPTVLPGLISSDLIDVPSLRSDSRAIAVALSLTGGCASTLLPLVADLRDTRDVRRSVVRLLRPGGAIEIACRRHYEVLLLRSRGYAVSKRAAEVTASAPNQRLTDLFPRIGRTAGASRQYLRWLVEVGLLVQTRKRYNFADPMLGLWAALYLGERSHPTDDQIDAAVESCLGGPGQAEASEPTLERERVRRADRFEEID